MFARRDSIFWFVDFSWKWLVLDLGTRTHKKLELCPGRLGEENDRSVTGKMHLLDPPLPITRLYFWRADLYQYFPKCTGRWIESRLTFYRTNLIALISLEHVKIHNIEAFVVHRWSKFIVQLQTDGDTGNYRVSYSPSAWKKELHKKDLVIADQYSVSQTVVAIISRWTWHGWGAWCSVMRHSANLSRRKKKLEHRLLRSSNEQKHFPLRKRRKDIVLPVLNGTRQERWANG